MQNSEQFSTNYSMTSSSIIPTNTEMSSKKENTNDDTVKNFEQYGQYLVLGVVGFGFFVACCAKIYQTQASKRGSDNANYLSLLIFFQSTADFLSDLFFTFILYLQNEITIFIASIMFTAIPYLISIIVGLYWMHRWRIKQEQADRLVEYFSKYESLFAVLTIISGFYATVELLQSKIFYNNRFNLSLKKYENMQLKHLKFLNITLFENIPQFVIQIIYIFSVDSENLSPIVFLSMILSILSIILTLFSESSRICQLCRPRQEKFGYETTIISCLTIECDKLKSHHQFAKKKIENSIFDVLTHSNDEKISQLRMRSDVSFSIECFYIVSSIKTLGSMTVYFEIAILSINDNFQQIFHENIENMGEKQHNNYIALKTALMKMLHIQNDAKLTLSISDVIVHSVNLAQLQQKQKQNELTTTINIFGSKQKQSNVEMVQEKVISKENSVNSNNNAVDDNMDLDMYATEANSGETHRMSSVSDANSIDMSHSREGRQNKSTGDTYYD